MIIDNIIPQYICHQLYAQFFYQKKNQFYFYLMLLVTIIYLVYDFILLYCIPTIIKLNKSVDISI